MKRILITMLGLTFVIGSATLVIAADDKKDTHKEDTHKGDKKDGKDHKDQQKPKPH